MFSLRSSMVSDLTFMSLIHFKLIFIYYVRLGFNFILLHMSIQFSQYHILKGPYFPYCIFLKPLLLAVYIWVYFWSLYSVSLVYVSVFMPVSYCFDSYIFYQCFIAVVPNLFGTRYRFHGRQFFHGWGGIVQVVMRAMGSNGEWPMKFCSHACPWLTSCGPVPNRPQTGTSLQPGG